jgi:hypothetical protein
MVSSVTRERSLYNNRSHYRKNLIRRRDGGIDAKRTRSLALPSG